MRADVFFAAAQEQVHHGWQDAFAHRKEKKREFRKLWIARINAAVREHGLSYSKFMHLLNKSGSQLDRKVLAEMAYNDPAAFKAIVDSVR